MKKLFPGKNKNNLVGGAAILLIISFIAASPFTVVLSSFAASPPPIAKFCSTYKQPTNIPPINQNDCQTLVAQVNNPKEIVLLENQSFFSAMLASLNASSVERVSNAFTKECNASSFFKTTPPVASCTKQAENFALFLNRIDPGNPWPTQSLGALATANSLWDGTAKIADQKHFAGEAGSFNHGLRTILLTGVTSADKSDTTGFIGALWNFHG